MGEARARDLRRLLLDAPGVGVDPGPAPVLRLEREEGLADVAHVGVDLHAAEEVEARVVRDEGEAVGDARDGDVDGAALAAEMERLRPRGGAREVEIADDGKGEHAIADGGAGRDQDSVRGYETGGKAIRGDVGVREGLLVGDGW